VGGGIFRASGERKVFATDLQTILPANGEEQPPVSSRFPVTKQPSDVLLKDPEIVYEAPSTLFDFNKLWNSLSSPKERWEYLNVCCSCFSLNFNIILTIFCLDNRTIRFAQAMSDLFGTFFACLHPRNPSIHPFRTKGSFRYQTADNGLYGRFFESAKVRDCGAVTQQKGKATREAGMGVVRCTAAKWCLEVCRIE